MIENKIITIIKENTFRDVWRIFERDPDRVEELRNPHYCPPNIADIVKKITFAKAISFAVFSDFCLPKRIQEELTWVNKYITFHVYAKDETVLSSTGKWRIQTTVLPSVKVNAISISFSDSEITYVIDDGLHEIKNSINEIISPSAEDFSCFEPGDRVWLLDKDYTGCFLSAAEYCKAHQISCTYVITPSCFSQDTLKQFAKKEIIFAVADIIKRTILVEKANGDLAVQHGVSCVAVEKAKSFLCNVFLPAYLTEELRGNGIPNSLYLLQDGMIKQVLFQDEEVKATVQADRIEDYFEERFDRSVTDRHSDFQNASAVRYIFTLMPPRLGSTYQISDIYKPLYEIADKLQTEQPDFIYCEENLKQMSDMVKRIEEYFHDYHFAGFNETVRRYISDVKAIQDSIYEQCLNINLSYNASSDSGRYSKFDDEIAGYQNIIKEKQLQIESGIEVMNARRRIEILQKKIDELTAMKKRFAEKETGRSTDAEETFRILYNGIMNGEKRKDTSESVGKVIGSASQDDKTNFENYLYSHLTAYTSYVKIFLKNLQLLFETKIPENDIVYQKKKQNYICIDSEAEYEDKKDLCQKYNLLCIARRLS